MTVRDAGQRKQIHLGAHFPGVNNTTVWSDPSAGSQIAFESFVHLAQTAERGLFDFFFLAEGLRLREHRGKIHDLDVVGRPDTFTVLAALAAVTDRLGLAGTINTTFNEPFEVARQFATLDHLSDGRAAWNMVTSSDAFTGENFRRGGFLAHADRYHRAEEFIRVARKFWDSWAPDAVIADVDAGIYADPARIHVVDHFGPQFGVHGVAALPAGPQGHPVLLQAGDSSDGRDFGAKHADALFTLHGSLEAGQRYYADVKGRAAAHGRDPDQLKVLPGATFALGDTPDEAQDNARHIREQQVSGPTAIAFLEQVWGVDLSAYDPDGPLPDVDPVENPNITRGRVRHGDPTTVAQTWRARAEAENLSIRELIIEVTSRQQFVGTPQQVAVEIDRYVQSDACDGFILVPHLTPHGLDEFVDKVVPLLQERGSFRTEYRGHTLREHLGLSPTPGWAGNPAGIASGQ
ncbi:NtaA/DmoA family FMN-dependent monooxygenase [Mycobacterium intracellulare]|uniref:Fmnh2-utilizing oxygenase n=1 Tax=Mycobacterium intracellulare subsp. chimaera TaxID=222805 RepID=A0A7U5MJH5_MYCIT|nr:NtaA/DmoA family FMN-dependent monooxygenase [Mycobacterium intracellulare]ASL14647.1 fmnh2-utilizing oxygenase [Mycobacterium intracellulare subsp. chimaera]ASQ85879.1 F420-dependent methylene-tetrahydromethanopterin reductase [Mycobacterium intracellulare subsp. chimaera]MCF1812685.1 NtaA/DmoA family FMN-dependent monooxygenase [Mycobacterium intracellulare subsp. intracellulare]MDM3927303.1 NtaA/DmoA family FMN-dependent monooxygenase [Mycobacterium intracellulare subsp. chimaera]MDS0333